MNEQLRIQKLQEIINNEKPYMTGIRIRYKGEIERFDAYKIPLEYLVYNKYNGRIGTLVKSFEKQKYSLNPESFEDKKIIERFLWESKLDRNQKTMQSLAKDGQQRYGIVSRNGVIIDGNRRASLLNRIYEARDKWDTEVSNCRYFIAIVLPDDAGKKEILELETTYQMGVDEKLDYNPIEKYLKCQDLKDAGFSEKEIADMMKEKEGEVKKWLEILTVMNEYLDQYGYSGIYTRLEKREGQFVDLNRYLNRYTSRKVHTDWEFDESDISDLKLVCFDYIRAQYEGKEFRNIANADKDSIGSIFCSEKIWNNFQKKHFDLIDNVSEADVDKIRENNPGEDLSKLLEKRDNDWEIQVKNKLQANINISSRKLDDLKEANQPSKLLLKIKDTLELINTDVENFHTDEVVFSLIKEISKITWEYKKIIENRRKH